MNSMLQQFTQDHFILTQNLFQLNTMLISSFKSTKWFLFYYPICHVIYFKHFVLFITPTSYTEISFFILQFTTNHCNQNIKPFKYTVIQNKVKYTSPSLNFFLSQLQTNNSY